MTEKKNENECGERARRMQFDVKEGINSLIRLLVKKKVETITKIK